MSKIDEFLVQNELRIAQNPCFSPDFCLDWPALSARLLGGQAEDLQERGVARRFIEHALEQERRPRVMCSGTGRAPLRRWQC